MTKKQEIFILLVILILASFFRLYKLSSIPPGLYPDEAINGNDAFSSLKNKDFKIFYPENNGREGLFINLIAFSFFVLGPSIFSLKIISAISGILTVLGIYLLTKEIFQNPKFLNTKYQILNTKYLPLLSAFFLSVSFWHTNFSRIAFRGILVPLILSFSFYFLFKGFKLRKVKYLIGSGIIFGLGFYTYIAFRMAVILLFLSLLIWLLLYKKAGQIRLFFYFSFLLLISIFLTALPIGIYFLNHPQDFISRATGVSIFSQPSPLKAGLLSLKAHLLMFNFKGDPNLRHNISPSPILFFPVGIFFLIGIFYSLYKIFKSLILKDLSTFNVFFFLLAFWGIMLLPGILTFEGIPHSLRCIGAIPPTFIFSALGCVVLIKKINSKLKISFSFSLPSLFVAFTLIFFLFSFVFAQYFRYFIKWGQNPEVAGAFTQRLVKIGEFLNAFPPDYKKYVIVNESGVPVPYPEGIPMPSQTPMFIEITKYKEIKSIYLTEGNLDKIKKERKTIIVPLSFNEEISRKIKKQFPKAFLSKGEDIYYFLLF